MKRQDFSFELPTELIAQYPLPERSASRLLVHQKGTGRYEHRLFTDLPSFLEPGDLLVMNDTRVIPARLYGYKASGGKVELLVERLLTSHTFLAHIKASQSPKADQWIHLDKGWKIEVLAKEDDLYHCRVDGLLDDLLEEIGHVPLPPYMTRPADEMDKIRYQTIYARHKGSVAAPTAGLHFDDPLMKTMAEKGVQVGYVTLHVGAGTFRPVRVDNIIDHKMHPEQLTITEALCEQVHHTRAMSKRVIAVGTTALRCLESAVSEGCLQPGTRDTDIFIRPGYSFQLCDGLITNFHLPESTLLMLVSAFIGHPEAMALYRAAVSECYRFFSYGDAMFLLRASA